MSQNWKYYILGFITPFALFAVGLILYLVFWFVDDVWREYKSYFRLMKLKQNNLFPFATSPMSFSRLFILKIAIKSVLR